MTVLRLLARTRLLWGLIAIVAAGVASSPLNSHGENIFLSPGNLFDVLRQVSIVGLLATGMTAVILTAGIDLSVGSLLALSSVVAAQVLTKSGPSAGLTLGAASFVLAAALTSYMAARIFLPGGGSFASAPPRRRAPILVGIACGAAALLWFLSNSEGVHGLMIVLLLAPSVGLAFGALNGLIIVFGRLQPFIVALAMMVMALGIARLTAGENSAAIPIYAGENATADIEWLRATLFGFAPAPGLVFVAALAIYWAVLRLTPFGRYVYAIGGNEEAARLSGVPVMSVKVAVYAISGLLAGLAAVLYVAQYRQGKPDAGAGLELDAIAAVVIGGTSLMGGRGGLLGAFCGVLIFGLLSNLLQLHNINSNLQLVLKGVIIVGAVLLQERNFTAPFTLLGAKAAPRGANPSVNLDNKRPSA